MITDVLEWKYIYVYIILFIFKKILHVLIYYYYLSKCKYIIIFYINKEGLMLRLNADPGRSVVVLMLCPPTRVRTNPFMNEL